MNVSGFVSKWKNVQLTERSAAQQHFIDLCDLLEHPRPADADPAGEWFTFEKGAAKSAGGDGFADVWKRGFFGWEYKGKHKDLDAAYQQLLQYRESLENPPVLVVCDMERIIVRTNFTNTATATHEISLEKLDAPRSLEILRAVFFDPERLKPGATSEAITTDAAQRVAEVAQALRGRGLPAEDVAHFLDRIVFCLFAEDVGLLPRRLLTRILEQTEGIPGAFAQVVGQLFQAMAHGGFFGADAIRHFDGNLFNAGPVLSLTRGEMRAISRAAALDWGAVDPSIFGTLFERGMDPEKRSQLGAHYTSREDIETLVEPVVMQPLRREWAEVRETVTYLLATGEKPAGTRPPSPPLWGGLGGECPGPPNSGGLGGQQPKLLSGARLQKARDEADAILHRFLTRLTQVKVLDPACGSGNFLYVTLQKLKDLEKEAIVFGMANHLSGLLPLVGPWQLYGIEVNPYAFDLAQMTVWIGYLQWTRANGFSLADEPLLRAGSNFQCKDAILDLADPENPREPEWPRVDYIVGNPPFLGGKKLRSELGDEYVDRLFVLWRGRVPAEADLCCYWFEKARGHLEAGGCKRAGLLATQGIRGGANREVLKRIKASGDIFFAESDRPWILDGANVHVSMVAFDDRAEQHRVLDGSVVTAIAPNLHSDLDISRAGLLAPNAGLSFMGDTKGGSFDLPADAALPMLHQPNPHGRPNSDVVVPWANGLDVTRRSREMWVVDFGTEASEVAAGRYEVPFEYIRRCVMPVRLENKREAYRIHWWRHVEARPGMRGAIAALPRFLATTTVSKHRLFMWMQAPTLPDHQLIVFARDDDYFFGVLHSRAHEVWARAQGTQVRERESGFRYTPTTCFETFPFPEPAPAQDAGIAAAAKELNALRERWLNPPEWTREEVLEFPGAVEGPWARYVEAPNAEGVGTVRYPRIVARPEHAAELAKRTLTNLYNARPAWLAEAHRRLDEAVFAAYGWPAGLGDEEILARLLELNLSRH